MSHRSVGEDNENADSMNGEFWEKDMAEWQRQYRVRKTTARIMLMTKNGVTKRKSW